MKPACQVDRREFPLKATSLLKCTPNSASLPKDIFSYIIELIEYNLTLSSQSCPIDTYLVFLELVHWILALNS